MKKRLIMVPLLAIVATAIVMSMGRISNCGGNSAALSGVRQIAMVATVNLAESNQDSPLSMHDLLRDPELPLWLDYGWGVKSYWLKKEIGAGELQPIAICGEEFSNVPEPRIWNLWRRNPGHAASYLGGATVILAPEEFQAIDFEQYILITTANEAQLRGVDSAAEAAANQSL